MPKTSKFTTEQQLEICASYNELKDRDKVAALFKISAPSVYRFLKLNNISTTHRFTHYDDEEFTNDYTNMSEYQLVGKYKTSYDALKMKAHRLKIRRPRNLDKHVEYESLIMPKSAWLAMTPDELKQFKEDIFNYYRRVGFPYYQLGDEGDFIKKLIEAKNKDYEYLIRDNKINPTILFSSQLWSYFPTIFNTSCEGGISPVEFFSDDRRFRKLIDNRIKHADNMSDAAMRRGFRLCSKSRIAYNFRPSTAAAIYSKYGGDGVVYDCSAGYGGRMLGAYLSNRVHTYIGVDPCTDTFHGLEKLREVILSIPDEERKLKNIFLYKEGSEHFVLPNESVDLVFTSPPYFNTEHYSNEPTQSYIAYPTPKEWIDNFLYPTIKNGVAALKSGGHILINIKNVKSFPDLEDATQKVLRSFGLKECDKLDMLFNVLPQRQKEKGVISSEPIFVFQK